ncbi:MAG TPA: DUF397 domain-containing protein [Actinoplanes sp.]|jgi:hypothetical protein
MSNHERSSDKDTGVRVEVSPDGVVLRNSRDPEKVLRFTPSEWSLFLRGVKRGEFD